MDAAALMLLVSGVAVGIGWQPMPDGTPRYEYIVQVDPELAGTLADGQSIPIVGEVPQDVHPIGRVRVVVGRGNLPRQRIVTLLKPTGEPASAGMPSQGVKLSQYYQPTTPPAAIPASPDRYGNPAPSGASEWNNVTPPATGIAFSGTPAPTSGSSPNENSWNNPATSPIAPAVAAPLPQISQGLQRVTGPIQDGLGRVDESVRNVVDDLGGRTQEILDKVTRPLANGSNAPAAGQPAQPPIVAGNAGLPSAPMWNGGATEPPTSGATSTTGAPPTNDWNQADVAPPFAAPRQPTPARYADTAAPPAPGNIANPSQLPVDDKNEWNTVSAADNANGQRSGALPNQPPAADPFANASDPRLRSPNVAAPRTPNAAIPDKGVASSSSVFGGNAVPWASGGPQSPNLGAVSTASPFAGGRATSQIPGAAPPALGVPEISKTMLAQPGGRPLDGVEPGRVSTGSVASGPPMPSGTSPTLPQSSSATPSAAAQGWEFSNIGATRQAAQPTTGNQINVPPTGGRDHAAVALFAWVLLCSSAAGNLYLFWSYLDVRSKYRHLVRKTARAVGNRFSAA